MYLEISDPMEYRVALYIRLSKEDENEGPSQSVQNQESMLREFTERNHLRVFDTYVDDGWSGSNFERPNFKRMISDIEARRVNMVITKDLSRLGRDYILTGHYLERYFPEHQVRYISLLDGIDSGVDSTANDITPFRAIMNDMYAKDISKKTKSVKRDKQRKGLFIGPKPVYGYKRHPTDKNKLVIDEEVAPVVRRMFEWAERGLSAHYIATKLNEEGVPSPSAYANLKKPSRRSPYSGKWNSEYVTTMLKNETYIGNMVQGRSMRVSYKSRKSIQRKPEDWYIVNGTHEPLVDSETFQMVQMRLSGLVPRSFGRRYYYPLKGIIFCHECGYPLGVVRHKNVEGKDVLYFICRTYQRFSKLKRCTCHSMREDKATKAVIAKVKEVCRDFLWPELLVPEAERALDVFIKPALEETELCEVKESMKTLTENLDRLYADRLSGVLSDEDFRRFYVKFDDERRGLRAKQAWLEERRKKVSCSEEAKKLAREFLESEEGAEELVLKLIDRVELTQYKDLIIHFRFEALNETARRTDMDLELDLEEAEEIGTDDY